VPNDFETIEKRRYLRLADNFRVALGTWSGGPPAAPPEDEAASAVAFSRDVSVSGLCVVCDRSFPEGGVVEAEISVPELDDPLKVAGEVVRCASAAGGRYEIALRFVPHWIDEDVRARLKQLIYQ
jgi:hypothetical protein